MRRRAIAFAFVTAAALAGSAFCRERGRPDPDIRMAISHDRQDAAGGAVPGGNVPSRLVVPPEVTAAYSAIRVQWKDSSSGQEGSLDVPIGGSAPLPDSSLEVRADVFLPAFTMNAEEITSTGIAMENPAARIAVIDQGSEVFSGWIFQRFPDVHPFQHPRFSLRLDGGVERKRS